MFPQCSVLKQILVKASKDGNINGLISADTNASLLISKVHYYQFTL